LWKRIGIIGGLSPESTTVYYKTITSSYRAVRGREDYPEIIIYSVCFDCFRKAVQRNDHGRALGILLDAAKSLWRAGADFALIAANTPHIFYKEVVAESPIPLISIVDAVAEVLEAYRVERVGLLATKKTVETSFYKKLLRERGIEVVHPPRDIADSVNEAIFGELVKGAVGLKTRRAVSRALEWYRENNVRETLLACTELSLLVESPVAYLEGVRVYDTARIHALKALSEAIGESLVDILHKLSF